MSRAGILRVNSQNIYGCNDNIMAETSDLSVKNSFRHPLHQADGLVLPLRNRSVSNTGTMRA